ncbi:hypothetical protein [Micromonospora sp. KC721]|uniref:hypothetical protein n=1 Tax=Micromonospora sp. KC721 TaxID=2530380 RepID=UPI00104819CD|nr:hypothetical protein [Micromonospora sp. KC721]TDB80152.1 hypothetical protein E1182_09930 [Micromonospora sp. KC721]
MTVGCAPTSQPPAPERVGPVYPTQSGDDVPPTPAGERPGRDDHDDRPSAAPPAAEAAPVAAAFAAAWVRRDLPADTWWRAVTATCDEGFARALRTVDPAQVPAARVTGRPVATQPPKDGVAVYEVATDAGTLTVRLAGVGGRWVVTGNDFVRSVSR